MKILLDHMKRHYEIFPKRYVRRSKKCLFNYVNNNHKSVLDNIDHVYLVKYDGFYANALSKHLEDNKIVL